MNTIKLGTFYTKNTPYKKIFEDYFQKSVQKFSIKYLLTISDNYGNWNRNVAEKPKVILEQLNTLKKDECLVFLDADAEIISWPVLFEEIPEQYDIAFHMLNWRTWYGLNTDQFELLSGTMFFRNNEKVRSLCNDWYKMAVETQEWEQKCLQKIISNYNLSIYEIPLEYCYPKNRPGGLEPLVKCNPVILHNQVSRELKKIVRNYR